MASITRPVFYDGQILTARDLNSISAYCAAETRRLRICCLAATVISWAAAVITILTTRKTTAS